MLFMLSKINFNEGSYCSGSRCSALNYVYMSKTSQKLPKKNDNKSSKKKMQKHRLQQRYQNHNNKLTEYVCQIVCKTNKRNKERLREWKEKESIIKRAVNKIHTFRCKFVILQIDRFSSMIIQHFAVTFSWIVFYIFTMNLLRIKLQFLTCYWYFGGMHLMHKNQWSNFFLFCFSMLEIDMDLIRE